MKPVFHPDIIKKYQDIIDGTPENKTSDITLMDILNIYKSRLRTPNLRAYLRQLMILLVVFLLLAVSMMVIVSKSLWWLVLPVVWMAYVWLYNRYIGKLTASLPNAPDHDNLELLKRTIESALMIKGYRIYFTGGAYVLFLPFILYIIGYFWHGDTAVWWQLVIPAVPVAILLTLLLLREVWKGWRSLQREWELIIQD